MEYDNKRITKAYQLFFNAMFEKDTLQALAKAAYHLIECPVLINNAFTCNIVQYPTKPIGNLDYDALLTKKISDYEHHEHFWKKYVEQPKESPIYINDGFFENTPQLFSVLKNGTSVIGFTSFLCPDAGKIDEYKEIIQLFNMSVIKELTSEGHASVYEKNQLVNTWFEQLLEEDPESEFTKKKFEHLSVMYHPNYALFIIEPKTNEVEASLYQYGDLLCANIRKRFRNYICLNKPGYIILLGTGLSVQKYSVSCADLLNYLEQFPVRVSISSPFSNLEKLSSYYMQVQLTMQIGTQIDIQTNDRRDPYRAENYSPLQIFSGFCNHYIARPFIHPVLKQIQSYDRKNHTEYLHTLRIYLFCMMDKKTTAEMLHVHFNTLTYRLKQLQNTFNIDFSNYFLLNNLVASFGLVIASGSHYPEFLQDRNPDAIKD